MNCYLHINNLSSKADFNKFVDMIRSYQDELPINIIKSCENERHCTLLLSNEQYWKENHEKIIEVLSSISAALDYATSHDAFFEITIDIDMKKYCDRNLTSFYFTKTIIQSLAKFNIKLSVTILSD